MRTIERLPAIPLVVNDPYFSIWCAADILTDAQTTHWSGPQKPLCGTLRVDGRLYRFLGTGDAPAMRTVAQRVTPTMTEAALEAGGVRLCVRFMTPALADDLDILSVPATLIDFTLTSLDGEAHETRLSFLASEALCFDGGERPAMMADTYARKGLHFAFTGQWAQKLLCHSGDHITMDWGYLYMASPLPVKPCEGGLCLSWDASVAPQEEEEAHIWLAYDDVVSILYYGTPCKAWYAREGRTLADALCAMEEDLPALRARCGEWDARVTGDARAIGGEDYVRLVSAAWRHTFAAHKLIATPNGAMALLSKENDSNGCIGTVDVSYPSIPLFLKYCPQLVDALCRPVLEFASMPVWTEDFAPHDVGRYPIVSGQVYAAVFDREGWGNGAVPPPIYQYPAGKKVYDIKYQMPVEECGNMLIMLAAAVEKTGDTSLAGAYRPLLDRWVRYLTEYGEDPGEQLCTDDFAGHLAHNINLSAKAIVGIACYGRLLAALGEESLPWQQKAREMAESWLHRARTEEGTALTFEGIGWSQKYNLVWDLVLDLGLLPLDFYAQETRGYLKRINTYGLPLDSRAAYTKSDWIIWSASMAQDRDVFAQLIAPVAKYLQKTPSRVPFSDWYDTVTGRTVHFIARSVQGGVFMPMLLRRKMEL